MLTLLRSLCLVLLFLVVTASAAVHADELDDVYRFLEDKAANRTLNRETKGTIADGAVAYEFRRDMTICNLVRSENRFRFDIIYSIKQLNWDVKEGKKIGEPRVEDRMIVERYEYGARKSTGEVVGFSRILTSTRADWGGTTETLRMNHEDGELSVEKTTAGYMDHFGPGDRFYPGATVAKETWFVRDGKLVIESHVTAYKVDPESLDKERLETDQAKENVESARLPLE